METVPKECLFCKEPLEGSPIPVRGGGGGEMTKTVTVLRTLLNLQSKCEDEGCDHPVCKLESSLVKSGVEDAEEGGTEDVEGVHVRCEGNRSVPLCERCSKVIHDLLGLQKKQLEVLGNLNLPSHSEPRITKGHPPEEVEELMGPDVDTEDLQMSLAVKIKFEKQRLAFRSLQQKNNDLTATLKEARFIFGPKFRIWERKWSEQKFLMKEMEPLKETVEGLKRELIKIQKENVTKDEEARKLLKRVAKLRMTNIVQPLGAGAGMDPSGLPRKRNVQIRATRNVVESNGPLQAIDVFPEEVSLTTKRLWIWNMILDNLTEVDDFVSCSKTCSLFYRILKPTRTTWMFKQVFPVLCKFLSGKKILNCRPVCKSWAIGVEHFFENHISRRPHSSEECDPRNLPFVHPMTEKGLGGRYFTSNTIDIMDMFDVRGVEELFMDHAQSRNPIVGRGLKIIEYDDQWANEEIFWENVQKLLELYGKHIWYLTIYLLLPRCASIMKPKFILKFLTVDIFRLVPNLRKLRICCRPDWNDFGDYETILDRLPSVKAPYLETLQVENLDSTVHQPIMETLLARYHNQLQRLHLKAEEWRDVCLNEWPELTELHLEKMSDIQDFDSLLEMYTPSLNKLGFGLEHVHDWTFDKLLNVIIRLSSTYPLNTVRLSGKIPRNAVTNMKTNLYWPSELKTLEVEHLLLEDWGKGYEAQVTTTAYEFLTRFPFLQNLHLFCREIQDDSDPDSQYLHGLKDVEGRSGSEVALMPESDYQYFFVDKETREIDEAVEVNQYLYYHEMYDSNVWEVLPRLKLFTFNHRIYTREGYEAYKDGIDDLPYKTRMEKRLTVKVHDASSSSSSSESDD